MSASLKEVKTLAQQVEWYWFAGCDTVEIARLCNISEPMAANILAKVRG